MEENKKTRHTNDILSNIKYSGIIKDFKREGYGNETTQEYILMRVIFIMIRKMGKGNLDISNMEIYMKVNLKKAKFQEKVNIHFMINLNRLEILKIMKWMVKVLLNGLMEIYIKENMLKGKEKDPEYIN